MPHGGLIQRQCLLMLFLQIGIIFSPMHSLLGGIFQSRPPLPRYCKTWDVDLVLQYIGSMGNSQELSLKDLTLKLVMLVVLTTAQRGQSLHLLDTQNMVQEVTAYTFMLNSNLKQSKPGRSTSELVISLMLIHMAAIFV